MKSWQTETIWRVSEPGGGETVSTNGRLSEKTIQVNTDKGLSPRIVRVGNTIMMVTTMDAGILGSVREDGNEDVLVYSFYENGEWTDPAAFDDDGTADYNPDVYAADDKIYVVWQNASESLAGIADLEERASRLDPEVMVYDCSNSTLSSLGTVSGGTGLEQAPQIVTESGNAVVYWYENAEGNPLGLTGTNSFYRAEYAGDAWTIDRLLADGNPLTSEQPILSMDAGRLGSDEAFAFVSGSYGEDYLLQDTEIHGVKNGTILDFDGGETSRTDRIEFTVVGGDNSIVWHNGSSLYQMTGTDGRIFALADGNISSSSWRILNDERDNPSIFYTVYGEGRADLYRMSMSENGCFGYPLQISESAVDEYIEHPDGFVSGTGSSERFVLIYNRMNATLTEEAIPVRNRNDLLEGSISTRSKRAQLSGLSFRRRRNGESDRLELHTSPVLYSTGTETIERMIAVLLDPSGQEVESVVLDDMDLHPGEMVICDADFGLDQITVSGDYTLRLESGSVDWVNTGDADRTISINTPLLVINRHVREVGHKQVLDLCVTNYGVAGTEATLKVSGNDGVIYFDEDLGWIEPGKTVMHSIPFGPAILRGDIAFDFTVLVIPSVWQPETDELSINATLYPEKNYVIYMDGDEIVQVQTVYTGEVFSLPSVSDNDFDGWYSSQGGRGKHYTEGKELNSDLTLYAHYRTEIISVSLNADRIALYTGDKAQLITTVLPAGAKTTYRWSSSRETVAIVDQSGHVTALAPGTSRITVKIENGQKASCVVTVKDVAGAVKVAGIQISDTSKSIGVGKTFTLTARVQPKNADNTNVSWKSNNPLVAKVTNAGTVTGISAGKTDIIVTTEEGGYTASCNVTVKEEGTSGGGGEPVNPDKPEPSDDPDTPKYDDGGEGIEPGDLPKGREVPKGLWIGGLQKSYPYTGNAVKPEFRVYYGERRLVQKQDYTISYKSNRNVGTDAQIVVVFKGDFTGTKKASFEIVKNSLKPGSVSADILSAVYKKRKKNNTLKPVLYLPDGTVMKYTAADFELEYLDKKTLQKSDCIDAGDYIVRMKAKSTSKGYAAGAMVDIPLILTDKKPIMSKVTAAGKKSFAFTGERLLPDLTLKYVGNTIDKAHYTMETVTGDNYTDPGNHILIFKGDGINVFGMKRVTYKITGKRKLGDNPYTSAILLSEDLDEAGQVPYTYGGARPEVIVSYNGVRLKKGKDYTLSYRNNKKIGETATLTIKGIGGYAGSRTIYFKVSKRKLTDLILTLYDRPVSTRKKDYEKNILLFTDQNFTDQKLRKNTDYTVEYTVSSGTETPAAGDTVSVNIKAKDNGNYTGELRTEFRIIDKTKDLGKARITINKGKAYDYTGRPVLPAGSDVIVKLGTNQIAAENYDLLYYNNVNRSNKAVIVIRGKNGYAGGKAVTFRIGGASFIRLPDLWDGVIQTK